MQISPMQDQQVNTRPLNGAAHHTKTRRVTVGWFCAAGVKRGLEAVANGSPTTNGAAANGAARPVLKRLRKAGTSAPGTTASTSISASGTPSSLRVPSEPK